MIDRRRRTVEAAERVRERATRAAAGKRADGERGARRSPGGTEGTVRHAAVTIDAIAAGGDGVGRADGLAVFVPRSAPGDTVDVSLVTHGRFARGRIDRIVTLSPVRTKPLCRHYDGDTCGGCQLQHMHTASQREAKTRIVRDTLLRIGRRTVELPDIEASPEAWDYRQKFTLTLVRPDRSAPWTGGLHRLGEPDAIFALEECRITRPLLVATWHDVRRASSLLPPDVALRLTFRTAPGEHVALTVWGGSEWPEWAAFAAAIPSLAALRWVTRDGVRHELVSPASGAEEAGAGFVQANASLADTMHRYVVDQVQRFAPRRVVDAYAGTGAVALALASAGVAVTAIEWDSTAVGFMQRHLPTNSVALGAPVETIIDRALRDPAAPDVVVLNPPRTGAAPAVGVALEGAPSLGVRGVVYVSCDPATLARDLARMPSWRVESLRCFDMFPQTAHVETVCVLVPETA